ncbi:alpha/beta hydrolase [Lysobacter sp. S4-A87]|uniref:alpha/beta fold hydrolase n=1 Tax=Lysobacter sp. S4-A87 TaxID=2925843 RepID=UPI001F5351B0|nr:alpha/beta hydrolase [Lysobacter sp. S4-A87]UNK48006.1 alpha/beta hydrolase [Lysobacter sp. S4-A87]
MKVTYWTMTPVLLLVLATPAAAAVPQRTPDSYAQAGERVSIAPGRAINLRCSGKGPRTVVLEAGGNADSSTWFRVQSLLSDKVRVCSYDRAGYGFSDPGPMPRSLQADVDDLHALLEKAKLKAPLVLVGHSLGSNIVRRYAQQYPSAVTGLVLVDPPEQGAEGKMPAQWRQDDEVMRKQRNTFLDACAQAAAGGTLGAADGPLKACLREPPAWQSPAVAAAIRAYKLKPGYWTTLHSELDENTAIFAAPVPPDASFGAMPVVVLSADNDFTGVSDDVRGVLVAARNQTHARLVAASTRGRRVDVPGASHEIQLDQPQVVVDAVTSVVSARP